MSIFAKMKTHPFILAQILKKTPSQAAKPAQARQGERAAHPSRGAPLHNPATACATRSAIAPVSSSPATAISVKGTAIRARCLP